MQLDLFDSLKSSPPPRVFVRHPRARRYIVRVTRDGTVRITIPRWGSKREGERFADAQRAWIERQIARWTIERSARPDVPSPEAVEALKTRARRELPPRLPVRAPARPASGSASAKSAGSPSRRPTRVSLHAIAWFATGRRRAPPAILNRCLTATRFSSRSRWPRSFSTLP